MNQTVSYGSNFYAPVFRFASCDGTFYTVSSSVYEFPSKYQIGDEIRIIYPLDRPQEVEFVGRFAQWGVVFVSSALALWAIIIGGIFLLFWR